MNPHQHSLELARRYVEGTATAEETRALEAALRTDVAFRRQFLRYTNMDAALGSGRLSAAPVASPAQATRRPAWFGRPSRHPLAAAAANWLRPTWAWAAAAALVIIGAALWLTPSAVQEPEVATVESLSRNGWTMPTDALLAETPATARLSEEISALLQP